MKRSRWKVPPPENCLASAWSRRFATVARGSRNREFHAEWAQVRAKSKECEYSDSEHPYRRQGSADVNLYKLFVEQAYVLLKPSGRLGFIHAVGHLLRAGCDPVAHGKEWIHEDEVRDVVLPLYEGRMTGQFKFSQKPKQRRGLDAPRDAPARRSAQRTASR